MDTAVFAKRIGFVVADFGSCSKVWDPDEIFSVVAGAEEAVIYAALELAARGNHVSVFGHPPQNSPHSLPTANPRYLDVSSLPDTKLDIAIVKCFPGMGPIAKKVADKVYFWIHGWRGLSPHEIDSFDGVLWLSKFQRGSYVDAFPVMNRFKTVFGNGIDPNQFPPIVERTNPYSCIYGTNYAWGLNVVLDQWPTLKDRYPQATLDIYYGWNGVSDESKKLLQSQIAKLNDLDVKEHGQVSYVEINHAYSRASFWLFPSSTQPESFCISALKAQYAGAIPVVYRWAALKETVQHGWWCRDLERFPEIMMAAMEMADSITMEKRKSMRAFIDENYTWQVIVDRWLEYFKEYTQRD